MNLACNDCGFPYGGPGWCDCVIPNDTWKLISPTHDEGGILCFTCIAKRLETLGIDNVPLMVTSGPFLHDPARARESGWNAGFEWGRNQRLDLIRQCSRLRNGIKFVIGRHDEIPWRQVTDDDVNSILESEELVSESNAGLT